MNEMTTPTTDILESIRAIRVAATERHAALTNEMSALEEVFPSLRREAAVAPRGNTRIGHESRRPEMRAAASARMKARWALARNAEQASSPNGGASH